MDWRSIAITALGTGVSRTSFEENADSVCSHQQINSLQTSHIVLYGMFEIGGHLTYHTFLPPHFRVRRDFHAQCFSKSTHGHNEHQTISCLMEYCTTPRLYAVTVISAASTSEECANLVPLEDRRRGKGAFFSGCESRSATGRGGCWDSLVEEHSGCQSCIVQVRNLCLAPTRYPTYVGCVFTGCKC